MKKICLATIMSVVFITVFVFPFISQSAETAESAGDTLTLEQLIMRLEDGGKWSVARKEGELIKIEKDGENWDIDYVIFDIAVWETWGTLNLHRAYLVKMTKDGKVDYILGSDAMLSANHNDFKDTMVIGAALMVSWPSTPDKFCVGPGDKLVLLFVNEKSNTIDPPPAGANHGPETES